MMIALSFPAVSDSKLQAQREPIWFEDGMNQCSLGVYVPEEIAKHLSEPAFVRSVMVASLKKLGEYGIPFCIDTLSARDDRIPLEPDRAASLARTDLVTTSMGRLQLRCIDLNHNFAVVYEYPADSPHGVDAFRVIRKLSDSVSHRLGGLGSPEVLPFRDDTHNELVYKTSSDSREFCLELLQREEVIKESIHDILKRIHEVIST